MSKLIRVLNPNSNAEVTRNMSDSLTGLRFENGPRIDCVTFADGPFGIETQADIDRVIPMLCRWVETDTEADAFVIACYSDPGLDDCRTRTDKPVFGIQSAAVTTAMSLGHRYGVVALSQMSIDRHIAYLDQRGLSGNLAAERPLDLSVEDSAAPDAYDHLLTTARALRDQDGAASIILGCAGMARHRAALSADLSLPVVDPTWAAVVAAIGAVA